MSMSTRRRIMFGDNIPGKEDAVAGDILCAKADGSKMVYKAADYANISSDWTPIGVVVIPPSHDVYGTGEGAAVSLKYMNCSTPDNGSTSYSSIRWGQYGVDTELTNFNKYNITDNSSTPTFTVNNYTLPGNLPSDYFTGTQCTLDPVAYYKYSPYAPSPYLSDGSRYEGYYTTEYSEYNAFSDFDGVGNTNYLCSIATAQSDWKTASTITNSPYYEGYSPAACCCWRYHTTGTNQGDWYLPAMGELGYMFVRLKTIRSSISHFNTFNIPTFYQASTEHTDTTHDGVNTNSGCCGYGMKQGSTIGFIRF